MSSKRKHTTLALKEKMDILNKLDSGESLCKLAKEYGVGRSTIHDIKRKKQKIVDHVMTMESGPGKRKTLRVGGCPKMENALYMWFTQERSKLTPVTGETLKAKALELYKDITKKEDFRASDGWLDKFKSRFGIRLSPLSGEQMSCNESAVHPFISPDNSEKLDHLPDQINNADESGLSWRLLPNQTFTSFKAASTPSCKETETESIISNEDKTTKDGELIKKSSLLKKQKALLNEKEKCPRQSNDPAELYAHALALQLKEMNQHQRFIAERLIADVVFHGKMNNLTFETSVVCPPPPAFIQPNVLYTSSNSDSRPPSVTPSNQSTSPSPSDNTY